eukprot:scaffold128400_cov75-Phaeocystis_antarctica.AAC.4
MSAHRSEPRLGPDGVIDWPGKMSDRAKTAGSPRKYCIDCMVACTSRGMIEYWFAAGKHFADPRRAPCQNQHRPRRRSLRTPLPSASDSPSDSMARPSPASAAIVKYLIDWASSSNTL